MNFWNGARLLGSGGEFSSGAVNEILLNRNPSFSPGWKPGARRIAKPRKSSNLAPSGQSIASRTSVGDVYALAMTLPACFACGCLPFARRAIAILLKCGECADAKTKLQRP